MILFKRLSYKNFLSTGNQPIEVALDMSQTTLVVGTNGSGKSTLLDALCFVLFNRPFRIIKKEQMVNTINNGDCVVEVDFQVGTKEYKLKSIIPHLQRNQFYNKDDECMGFVIRNNNNPNDVAYYNYEMDPTWISFHKRDFKE